MLRTDGSVPTLNLFKQKRTKGWWPFSAKNENNEPMLQARTDITIRSVGVGTIIDGIMFSKERVWRCKGRDTESALL